MKNIETQKTGTETIGNKRATVHRKKENTIIISPSYIAYIDWEMKDTTYVQSEPRG